MQASLPEVYSPTDWETFNKYKALLDHDFYNEEIYYYYNKIIGKGNWYSIPDKTSCSHTFSYYLLPNSSHNNFTNSSGSITLTLDNLKSTEFLSLLLEIGAMKRKE